MGKFLVFEGIDGSGKTTQINLLAEFLINKGVPVACTREPGGTRIGLMLREVLLNRANGELHPRAEAFLYAADRAQHISEVILPALESGQTILCDRYLYSTLAYQGWGRGIDINFLTNINELASGGLVPDRVVLLDIDAVKGLNRALGGRVPDRLESEQESFFRQVRRGYLEQAKRYPEIFRVVNADAEVMDVHQRVLAALDLA